ncbi:MAG: RibD family protein [Geminicoccaceae bacterium]
MLRPRDAAEPEIDADAVWRLLLALRVLADAGRPLPPLLGLGRRAGSWDELPPAEAELLLDTAGASLAAARPPLTAEAARLLELHLPHALCPSGRRHAVAILGQSLDGFIATCDGQSRYINGEATLFHLHRLRALSDAVLIGVGTALADAPRLTTRHVPGPDPVRVVVDPKGRLPADSGLLHDGRAPTLVLRAADGGEAERPLSAQATALHLPGEGPQLEPAAILTALAARGLSRVLVEGGGRTVGCFLEAGLLDRLQLAVSPLILGAGRPALPVAPASCLERALRPDCRRHLMGEDVLFDLRPATSRTDATADDGGAIC